MLRPTFILGVALTLVPSCVVGWDSGIKIVTRQSFGERHVHVSTQYITASAWRYEYIVNDHPVATIVLHEDTVDRSFLLDLDAHEYAETELDQHGAVAGSKRVPVKSTGGTLDIWITATDTGERKEMFGHLARHIVIKERRLPGPGACSPARTSETDGWYIDSSVLPEWKRPKPAPVVVAIPLVGNGRADCFDKIELHHSGEADPPGFALKTTITVSDPAAVPRSAVEAALPFEVIEVTEFSEMPLDPALFKVPKDFRKVNELFKPRR